MPKYVVISNHPPESCPSANKLLNKRSKTLQKDLGTLLEKYKIKPEVICHLDPGHKILFVLEAPNSEAVRDLTYAAGLSQWNDFEFYMASSLDDILKWTEKLEPVW